MESLEYLGIEINKDEAVSMKEVEAYVDYLSKKFPKRRLTSVTMTIDHDEPEMINLE